MTTSLELPTALTTSADDLVVLLDQFGRPAGTAIKRELHGFDTPLHLAISCYVVRSDGDVLLTRRAQAKRTWPGVWTNACCGHPRPGESLEDAVRRHMRDEIGLEPSRLAVALPDFTYRATMDNGVVEHELCPVFVAEVDGEPVLDPSEADDAEWIAWPELVARARFEPGRLSPWSVTQISRLAAKGHVRDWLNHRPAHHRRPSTSGLVHADDPFAVMGSDVEDLVHDFMHESDGVLDDLDVVAREVAAPIKSLFGAGGKRIRPCFVYWGHRAAPGVEQPASRLDVARAAAAVEMLHTFALLHDDVMDRSVMRRGVPTAHVHFAELHSRASLVGDSSHFGDSAAIVAGDLAFVWADQLLDAIECAPERMREVRSLYTTLRQEVIAGQYLDLRLSTTSATDHQAITVALLKSARYSVTRPLQIGAALAGSPVEIVDALSSYGDAIGVAFQLRDDVLGVFGEPCATGKGAVEDLRCAKASLLLVRALELASPPGAMLLRRHLGNADLDGADADACRQVIADSGALASIEALIAARLLEAERALDSIDDTAASALTTLAHMLARRTA